MLHKKFNDEYKCYPMEVYYKKENGKKKLQSLNFGKRFQKRWFKYLSSLAVVPEGERSQPQLKEDTFKAVDGAECKLSSKNKIN